MQERERESIEYLNYTSSDTMCQLDEARRVGLRCSGCQSRQSGLIFGFDASPTDSRAGCCSTFCSRASRLNVRIRIKTVWANKLRHDILIWLGWESRPCTRFGFFSMQMADLLIVIGHGFELSYTSNLVRQGVLSSSSSSSSSSSLFASSYLGWQLCQHLAIRIATRSTTESLSISITTTID